MNATVFGVIGAALMILTVAMYAIEGIVLPRAHEVGLEGWDLMWITLGGPASWCRYRASMQSRRLATAARSSAGYLS